MPRYNLELAKDKSPEAIERRIEAALDTVSALCKGKQPWTLHIPVEQDDPDVVIADALLDARYLLHRTQELEGHLRTALKNWSIVTEEFSGRIDWHGDVPVYRTHYGEAVPVNADAYRAARAALEGQS